jgi:hypothetical protein
MSTKLVTKTFNVENAKKFISSNDELFVYASRHIPYTGGDGSVPSPDNSVDSTVINVYDNMIFAKRVSDSDKVHMIPKIMWTANTVYDMYSHDDGFLYEKDFYVVSNTGSQYDVYKCLYNAGGIASNVEPTRAGSAVDLLPFETGDQYVWKYMYTISSADWNKFSTTSFVPVTANTTVIQSAVPGQIDVIVVEDAGQRYDNYIANGVFRTGDIKVGGADTFYGVKDDASSIDEYYTGCVLRITNGTAVDQYRRIVGYVGTSEKKTVILDRAFTTVPAVGDTYQIYPYIYVFGDMNETVPAEAMAIIDANTSNSVSSVEILNSGAGYRKAEAYVGVSPDVLPLSSNSNLIDLPAVISGGVDFEEAKLKVIIPPAGGHGSDPYNELFADRVCVYSKFSNTEQGMISTDNDFRQIGIISNPKLNNLDVFCNTTLTVGSFSIGEKVSQFKNIRLAGNVTVSTTANTITKTDTGKISTTITIVDGGTGYNSTVNNSLVFSNPLSGGTVAVATFVNSNPGGTITSITVSNQGTKYDSAPTVSVGGSTGSNAVLIATLANPEKTFFDDCFQTGDYALVSTETKNWINVVSSVSNSDVIVVSSNSPFSNTTARVSKIETEATGTVTAISTGQITLSNVSGVFQEGAKIVGLSSGTTSVIRTSNSEFNALQINDKDPNLFNVMVQLSRLAGNLQTGNNFIEDEEISQTNLIQYTQPKAFVHHIETGGGANDDVLYVTNETGIFALDPSNLKPIIGESSDAIFSYLSAKYKGDFVKDSGQVIYFENVQPISRDTDKSEVVKIILRF